MRILIVSNYYPPHFVGGYELGCHEVVQSLRARGHRVTVLTSTYRVDGPQDDGQVFRWLSLTGPTQDARSYADHGRKLLGVEAHNQKAFRHLCRRFKPDIVYFWSMVGLSLSLAFLAERWRLPSCFYVSDHWFAQWQTDLWCALTRWRPDKPHSRLLWAVMRRGIQARGLLLPPRKGFARPRVQFCSQHLKDGALEAGQPVEDARVIHWGTNVPIAPLDAGTAPPRRLLYVGQIMAHKGVHTAIEAVHRLVDAGHTGVTLTLAGGSVDPEYDTRVRRQVADAWLEGRCRFTGGLPRPELLALYHDHDILIFPSAWEEPFAITPLEAMASGLAVVGTTTGGSKEIFEDGVNALTFPKEDAPACASQIERLLHDPVLFERIRLQGQKTIHDKYRFEIMVDQIEAALREAVR